ncbi:MAG: aminoacyl-tRNA hydrolase [Magnetococcales bacterium]|nr:aminoacyl-tRNA hydrolase [Magnetococcales bacterium]MBF0321967.1 aminoacyl-tRNA hydrolase [Magnetococcales bacterium]
MHLLVGLGNPGERYRATRHNLGWDAVLRLVEHFALSRDGSRFRGRWGGGQVGDARLFWLLPETFMNLSGEVVGEAVRFYKILPEEVVVFHDDMDLPLGKVRMKVGGGNAGHNGLKSIQQHLGTPAFVRVRLGVGRPAAGMDPVRFVLESFTRDEREVVDTLLAALPASLSHILQGDLPGAMNRLVNSPVKPARST